MEPIKTIGQILTRNEQRDCIHIAIFPGIAAEELTRGEEVGLVYGTTNQVKSKPSVYKLNPIGIVDPFLKTYSVKKGQKVWVFLFPGTITGLRHEWTHPLLDQPQEPKNDSELWLRQFADKWNFDYDEMVANAQEDDSWITARGQDLHSARELGPGDETLFWHHIENMTGTKFDQEHRNNFSWSCSC